MSRLLELPDAVYIELEELAAANGQTPADWIAARLPSVTNPAIVTQPQTDTMAGRLAGQVGRINSGGKERLSENTGEKFADYVEAKRRAGHL